MTQAVGLNAAASSLRLSVVVLLHLFVTAAFADSFGSLFSSPTYYGLAVAGISFGAAVSAALLGLLIYCLIRRKRKSKREAHYRTSAKLNGSNATSVGANPRTRTSADRVDVGGINGNRGAMATAIFGSPIALPTSASSNSSTLPSSAVKTKDSATRIAKYVNPAFDAKENIADNKRSREDAGSPAAAAGLYRHSSALRPFSYASLESSQKSSLVASPASSQHLAMTHLPVRTSPAGTRLLQLDARQYLSQGDIGSLMLADQQKRLSLAVAEELKLHQEQQRQQPHQLPSKRHSYAEQKSRLSSSIELTGGQGQVFAVPFNQQRFPSVMPALATQPEEPSGLPMSRAEEGPSFPQLRAATSSPVPQQTRASSDAASVETDGRQPQRSLHRINLGGDADDRRSVSSTAAKQDALKAFEFLDNYEDTE